MSLVFSMLLVKSPVVGLLLLIILRTRLYCKTLGHIVN